ncbi:MAG TPA: TonB-dependent receptor [Novosphingobium sp.]|nr:TonB-dependent receptor [Novosphingobium sp.]
MESDDTGGDEGEIIVTARKRDERLQEVPVAVTAFSGAQLERSGVSSFQGLALSNPNVAIMPVSSAAVGVAVAIRGNVQSANTLQVDPSVGVYVDGQIVAHTLGNDSLSVDVESVQTLKGPQGTLFGRNTTGGAMLVKAIDPRLGETSGLVSAEVGSRETVRLMGALNVPLGDVAALRLVYQNRSNGDYQSFSNGQKLGRRDGELLRAKLLLAPTDSLEIVFTAEKSLEEVHTTVDTSFDGAVRRENPRYDNVPLTSVGVGFSPADSNTNEELAKFRSEFYGIRATQKVSNGSVKLILGHRAYSLESAVSLPPSFGWTFQDKPGNKDWAAELQYNGSFLADRLDISTGLFYFDETIHESQRTFLYSGTQRSTRYLTGETKSVSGYLQGTFHATDALNFTGGVRYTEDEKKGTLLSATLSATTLGTTAAAAANPVATHYQKSKKANYLLSVDYDVAPDVMIYATHSTGYRAGGSGLDRRADNQPADPLYLETSFFLPESIKNYEVGFKSQFFDRMLTINGAAYYQDYSNYQYSGIDPVSRSRTTYNVGAEIKGFELEATLRLTTGTTLSATTGLTDAKVKDTTSPANGSRLPWVPKWTASASLNQNFELAGGDLDLAANYSWRSNFWTALNDPLAAGDEEGATNIRAVGLLNASITYTHGDYSLAVFGTNLTDERYFNFLTSSAPVINFGSLAMPRVIGVRGKYTF